jgi:hypothetical protein
MCQVLGQRSIRAIIKLKKIFFYGIGLKYINILIPIPLLSDIFIFNSFSLVVFSIIYIENLLIYI